MGLCRRVVSYTKDSESGFYCITNCKQQNTPSKFVHCEQQWYRIKTPDWLMQLWNTEKGDFEKPTESIDLFLYFSNQYFDMDGSHFYLPRNIINTMGNLNMFEYMIQNPSITRKQLMKNVKTPQNPIGFTPSVDPPCDYNICACRDAQNQKLSLLAKLNYENVNN